MDQALRDGGMRSTECPSGFFMVSPMDTPAVKIVMSNDKIVSFISLWINCAADVDDSPRVPEQMCETYDELSPSSVYGSSRSRG